MASYYDNYQTIRKALEKAFSQQDLSIRLKNIKIVKNQIDSYLGRYNQISSAIRKKYEQLTFEDSIQKESTRRYQAVKSYNQNVNSVQDLLKEGYLYVDALRTAFTGESISYQIAIKEQGFLYEGTMDLLEIIEHSTLDIDSKIAIQDAAKLRMTKVSATELHNTIKTSLEKNTENASSVFSAVYNYLTNTLHKTPKVNEGNAYEVYQRILFERHGLNKVPPPIDFSTIDRVYEEVKRNNAPYYKGGDIADIQVKYLGGKPASLTTLSSIKRVLTKSSKAFDIVYQNSKPKKAVVNSIVNLFTQKSSNLYNQIELRANEKAIQTIKDRLNSLAGIGITIT